MKQAIIFRGPPGSGKSTLARLIAIARLGNTNTICSTDSYHYRGGKYLFDLERLSDYHRMNLERFKDLCECEVPLVICDNTNMKRAHYQPYVDVAKSNGYEVQVITVGDFADPSFVGDCADRNVHGVPAEKIAMMIEGFES